MDAGPSDSRDVVAQPLAPFSLPEALARLHSALAGDVTDVAPPDSPTPKAALEAALRGLRAIHVDLTTRPQADARVSVRPAHALVSPYVEHDERLKWAATAVEAALGHVGAAASGSDAGGAFYDRPVVPRGGRNGRHTVVFEPGVAAHLAVQWLRVARAVCPGDGLAEVAAWWQRIVELRPAPDTTTSAGEVVCVTLQIGRAHV